jgi:hypothetical protein
MKFRSAAFVDTSPSHSAGDLVRALLERLGPDLPTNPEHGRDDQRRLGAQLLAHPTSTGSKTLKITTSLNIYHLLGFLVLE